MRRWDHESGEKEKERERGRRVEAGRALNNRFNWVMHEEVTYAKGPNLAARDLLLPAALPTRSGHSPSLLLSLSLLSRLLFRSIYPNDAHGNLFGPNSGSQSAATPSLFEKLSKDITKRIVRSVCRYWNEHCVKCASRFNSYVYRWAYLFYSSNDY